jgi:homoserine kinase
MSRAISLIHHLSQPALDEEIIREAFKDCIHQPYRQALIPGLEEVLKVDSDGILGVCLSGAGPTVLVVSLRGNGGEIVKNVFESNGVKAKVVEMYVTNGYVVG